LHFRQGTGNSNGEVNWCPWSQPLSLQKAEVKSAERLNQHGNDYWLWTGAGTRAGRSVLEAPCPWQPFTT